jgi:hypothetical protein
VLHAESADKRPIVGLSTPHECGSCRIRARLDCRAAIGASGALFIAWGLTPKSAEAFVGRFPYGNYVLKALAKLYSMALRLELREPEKQTAHSRVIQVLQALSTASETSIKVFRRGVVDCRIRAGGQAWRDLAPGSF